MSVKPSLNEFLFICLNRVLGSVEKKQQRRSIRTRSESEKSTEAVPKKKVKKEQVGFLHVELKHCACKRGGFRWCHKRTFAPYGVSFLNHLLLLSRWLPSPCTSAASVVRESILVSGPGEPVARDS